MIDPCVKLGERVKISPYVVLGGEPQDRSYNGEPTALEIGDDTIIREFVSIHRGTVKGGGVTRIGKRCMIMTHSHVGHDAQIGDDCTLAGGTMIAGHVVFEEHVTTGGGASFAQFVRVGTMAFVAAGARVEHAVPPYHIVQGDRACVRALNEVGLARNNVPDASRAALREAHAKLYRRGLTIDRALSEISPDDPHVRRLCDFIRENTCVPYTRRR